MTGLTAILPLAQSPLALLDVDHPQGIELTTRKAVTMTNGVAVGAAPHAENPSYHLYSEITREVVSGETNLFDFAAESQEKKE